VTPARHERPQALALALGCAAVAWAMRGDAAALAWMFLAGAQFQRGAGGLVVGWRRARGWYVERAG
jgi:hypothetical protein